MSIGGDVADRLNTYLESGVVVFMGIGNILKGDDGLGPE